MKVLVVLAHPDINSFNAAIADSVLSSLQERGHYVIFHDLYREPFDPVIPKEEIPKNADIKEDLEKHCRELAEADGIVIIHPNWWGQPPALLKGWIDRVVRPGVAYEFIGDDLGEGIPVGLLKAKVAVVFNTSNTNAQREANIFGDPLETIWKNCIFGLCGIPKFYRKIFRIVVTSTLEQRQEWLNEVRETIMYYFPKEVNEDDSKM